MYAFDLISPKSLDKALEALAEEEAQVLAGGQTLIPTLKARLAAPATLVSLRAIPELQGVSIKEGRLRIGAMTTHATVADQARSHFPALADLAANIGDPAVRNRGTIGGSLANNDPSACYPSAVLASGATIMTTKRSIQADDFFLGMFATDLEEGELIRAVEFPIPIAAHYEKFWQPASRFALTGVFVARYDNAVRVAVTGASEEGVFRWTAAEEALSKRFTADAVNELDRPDVDMISDLHGSAEYRASLTQVLTARAVARLQD
ncbi:carbon-monoxide dehydrogenase medium subunit [Roseinatronobacter thiooxidans]|uniref:Carbon-monoxide dehydrogenase medium subunit n=1 Tax=Roseinatronobacter thiooxidans TaxID=121821 RepID=A0A2W7PZ66_9RHOB|nr:FAD binding domain-containing protein [Roseinatronobacter thiooxidans]PZX37217.1 carbon-monoxide dehydrogenase medium subunit [Roseinatronobacter thiooxidans]